MFKDPKRKGAFVFNKYVGVSNCLILNFHNVISTGLSTFECNDIE